MKQTCSIRKATEVSIAVIRGGSMNGNLVKRVRIYNVHNWNKEYFIDNINFWAFSFYSKWRKNFRGFHLLAQDLSTSVAFLTIKLIQILLETLRALIPWINYVYLLKICYNSYLTSWHPWAPWPPSEERENLEVLVVSQALNMAGGHCIRFHRTGDSKLRVQFFLKTWHNEKQNIYGICWLFIKTKAANSLHK